MTKIAAWAGQAQIAGAPPGVDARFLGEVAQSGRDVLHVARDDARMATLAEALAFFHPDIAVLTVPAWDCLPYDRVSPNGEVVSRRIDALTELASAPAVRESTRGRVVITTVNAVLQRVPARPVFAGVAFSAAVGQKLALQALSEFLARNGYRRAETVREPGEYAVRGGIVDLFPPGTAQPLRIDLFGDTVEAIRAFDPVTQISDARLERFALKPVSEVPLDQTSIARFRSGYRELFGASKDDPLYEAISAGQRYAGHEHWLPLFHERLETLFDYVPAAAVTLDHQAIEAASSRLDQIAEFYNARQETQRAERASEGAPYRPLPPGQLYLSREEWKKRLAGRPSGMMSPFAPPETAGSDTIDAGGRFGPDFAPIRAQPGGGLFDAVRDHINKEIAAGRRVLIAAYSAGSRDRLALLLKEHGLDEATSADGWPAVQALPARVPNLAVLGLERGFVAPDVAVVTEQDILGDRLVRAAKRKRRAENFLIEASSLAESDLVVHVDHGIGRYDGLERIEAAGVPHDCLRVLYDGGDKLFVPVENIDVLSRYGSEEAGVQLDKLGGIQWQTRKARAKQRINEIAGQLMRIAAERQLKSGEIMAPSAGAYDEFCARFPYPETEDQARAIEEAVGDLSSGRAMDRLVCGDVGFGKTEVALRAPPIAALSGSQVAGVLSTTPLARHHFLSFRAP